MQNKKAERAKIFLPFASLRGFQTYLKQKEKVVVSRKQLSLDECDILNMKIHQVQRGKMIKVVYFYHGEYIEKEGMVTKVDLDCDKIIKIVNQVIDVKDIIDMSGEGILED